SRVATEGAVGNREVTEVIDPTAASPVGPGVAIQRAGGQIQRPDVRDCPAKDGEIVGEGGCLDRGLAAEDKKRSSEDASRVAGQQAAGHCQRADTDDRPASQRSSAHGLTIKTLRRSRIAS